MTPSDFSEDDRNQAAILKTHFDIFNEDRQISSDREIALRLASEQNESQEHIAQSYASFPAKEVSIQNGENIFSPTSSNGWRLSNGLCTSLFAANPTPTPKRGDEDIAHQMSALSMRSSEKQRNPGSEILPGAIVNKTDMGKWGLTSSRWATPKVPKYQCVGCQESMGSKEVIQASCKHYYCKECIGTFFELAVKDASSFPPKCCDEIITLSDASEFLSKDTIRKYENRLDEFNTMDKIYCSTMFCWTFIPPAAIIGDVATCPECRAHTCKLCKNKHHGEKEYCPVDPALQEFFRIGQEYRYKECNSCHQMVEKRDGCNKMKCFCGARFCYRCGGEDHDGPCNEQVGSFEKHIIDDDEIL